MVYKHSGSTEGECAVAIGQNLRISTKHSIEICNWIRGKQLTKAKQMLTEVLDKKRAVPFTRFNRDMGHKPGIGPGRYPIKAVQEILRLLESVESNAQAKGLNTARIKIATLCAQKAATNPRHGRHPGRRAKRTHIEVIVREGEKK